VVLDRAGAPAADEVPGPADHPRRPGVPGSTTVSFAAGGEDLAALAERLRAAAPAGARVEGPAGTPWFTDDLTIADADGNRVILTAFREAEMSSAAEWARETIKLDSGAQK
jgi:hypothetical protein